MQASTTEKVSVRMPQERRGIDALAMLIVAMMSVVLLVYVAFGEAKRTFEQFQIEKLVAQGQIVQSSVESFVRPGFPMHQYVGFNSLAEPMVKADPLIDAISAFDASGARLFGSGDQGTNITIGDVADLGSLREGSHQVRRSGDMLETILPVRNRFELVGYVVMSTPRAKLAEEVEKAFVPVAQTGVGAALTFAFFVYFISFRVSASALRNWVAGGFVATFIIVAVVVVSTLVSVYSMGAQARTKSLADSLGQRLDDLVIHNINMDDITGIIGLFGDYKRLNPDLRAAALIVDGKIRAHVDPSRRGTDWDSVSSDHEYTVRISPDSSPREVLVKVALPRDVVYRQVMRSVKNFTALLVASALFAALFMGLARSLQLLSQSRENGRWSAAEETATIDLVKPMFFLAVFVEHLSYAFLPSLMQSFAAAAKLPIGYASAPFIAYYVCFTLALIPAGRLETKLGARAIIMLGLSMAGLGLGAMAVMTDFWQATAARALCGLGQGTLFIGVQAYILANSSPERKTQAGGAIVFGFQAGMIAGMAIGSLLVSYLGSQGIFQLGAGLAVIAVIYGLMALPSRVSGAVARQFGGSVFNDIRLILGNGHFLRTMLLIGIPAKAVLTGVILFALPILLTQQGFPKEDIGQVTMLYACAVIMSSHFATASADRRQNTEGMLFKGTVITAFGLAMMSLVGFPGLVNWETSSTLGTFLIVGGATLVGVAHGFINAPVVTHVTNTELSDAIGTTNVAAGYRLLERFGHTIGPLIMGQVFVYTGISWSVFLGIAIAIFILGLLFLSPGEAGSQPQPDTFGLSMTMTPTRREALLFPAKALLLGSLGMSGLGLGSALAQTFEAPAANLPYWSWFKYASHVTEKWVVEATPGNPNRVTILSKRIGDAGPRQKMIVIYPRPSSAYDIAISKILSVFDDKLLNVEVTVVNFLNNDQRGMEMIKAAEAARYDLMLAMGSETTAWLWDNYKNGRIPVVSVCSKDPVVLGQSPGYNRGSGTNFAFTSLNMPIDVQMAYVNELKPKLRNIAVLVDSRNISAIETQAKPVITYAKAKGIRVIELAVQNPDNAKAELERMVKDATAQMAKNDPQLGESIFWVTGSTSVFREIATINAHAGRAAVISVVPEIVRGGDDSAVLSIGISFESNAHIAAVFAADVIRGRAKAGELKVGLVSPPDIAISFRKIREIAMTVPLSFFEAAGTIYDYDGKLIRIDGVSVSPTTN